MAGCRQGRQPGTKRTMVGYYKKLKKVDKLSRYPTTSTGILMVQVPEIIAIVMDALSVVRNSTTLRGPKVHAPKQHMMISCSFRL